MQTQAIPLHMLKMGQKASVCAMDAAGGARRRLMDLGLVRGAEVEALYRSPSGSPVAYLIRGAVIALREDIAATISVR